ncbi:hypothetical protein OCAE111667_06805 [Occultella aeris]|uniref:Uncharacterized protein n=1 Tax=Occultella aeris TaxID=2761496 RepID=A0A7M4DRT5_9MICO|nr:hypothetical protein HALOF300_04882 [Occultella aeris]
MITLTPWQPNLQQSQPTSRKHLAMSCAGGSVVKVAAPTGPYGMVWFGE